MIDPGEFDDFEDDGPDDAAELAPSEPGSPVGGSR